MKQRWFKRLTAWLLVALLTVTPVLAEEIDLSEALLEAGNVEDAVAEIAEADFGDLPDDAEDEVVPEVTLTPEPVIGELAAEAVVPEADAETPAEEQPEEPAGERDGQPEEMPDTQPAGEADEAPAADDQTEQLIEGEDAGVSEELSAAPSVEPSVEPSEAPSVESSEAPSAEPSVEPSAEPSAQPDGLPLEEGQPNPSPSPEASSDLDASPDPEASVTPEASVSPEPSVTPAPTALIEEAAAPKLEEAAPPLALPQAEVIMGKGEKRTITPVCDAALAAGLSWTSSKPKVVKVNQAGRLVAKKRGSAVITVTAVNGLTASCTVHVYKAPSKVTIQPGKKLALGVGETFQMSAKLPKNTGSGFTWRSGNPAVAVVDANGVVTAMSGGTAKITVKTFNGKQSSCRIQVVAAPTAVAFPQPSAAVGVGMTLDLKPVVNPGAASQFTLTSDNPGVAVTSGTSVTGVGLGTAVITASTYNGLTASMTVAVVPGPGAISLGTASLQLGVGEKYQLTPAIDPGTAASFTYRSSNKRVASVNAEGRIKARRRGSATITVTAYNGVKAKMKVKVMKAPSKVTLKPKTLALEAGGSYQLKAKLPKGSASRITFTSNHPEVATVDAAGVVWGLQPGSATITARTFNKKKATCKVKVIIPGAGTVGSTGATLALSSTGMVMMAVGANWNLTATSSTGSCKGIKWSTTSASIARVSDSGESCTVTGAGAGTAIVTARMPDGASASAIIMVVNTSDLSATNFNNVQKALLAHEELINSTAGGNVIWDMISAKLMKGNVTQARADEIISVLKAADPTYRNLYIYSFGTYSISAERDMSGGSNYSPDDNTLYLRRASSYNSTTAYDYVMFHESGHAIDYNADGNGMLNSDNDTAISILRSDIANMLNARMGDAIAAAGVSAASVDTGKVVAAMLDYRTLASFDTVRAELGMSDADVAVYNQLKTVVSGELNATLPKNNGTMVWDAVEGATNFDIHLDYGHYYLVKDTATYGNAGYYYFYDAQGNPNITTEPWAMFFSSNIMGDSNTIAKNLAYLPQTCKYFAETFVPNLLNYFTTRIRNL